jgi:hypothetical protein
MGDNKIIAVTQSENARQQRSKLTSAVAETVKANTASSTTAITILLIVSIEGDSGTFSRQNSRETTELTEK